MWKLIVALFFLSGCATINFQRYSDIDLSEKTVTVPLGGGGLAGDLKKTLQESGWKLFVDKGPDVVEGAMGERTKLEAYNTFNTRYRLRVESNQTDICLDASPTIKYDIVDVYTKYDFGFTSNIQKANEPETTS